MKKQRDEEEIAKLLFTEYERHELRRLGLDLSHADSFTEIGKLGRDLWTHVARRLLAALKRRGWTPPKPKKGRGK